MKPFIIALQGFVVLAEIFDGNYGAHLDFSPHDISISTDECVNVTLYQSENSTRSMEVIIESEYPEAAIATPASFQENFTWARPIQICGTGGGRTTIVAKILQNETLVTAHLLVLVSKGRLLNTISDIFGWIYVLAWSISHYPQCFLNYSRKSVVGMDFDFLTLHLIGFLLYLLYNCGMYFSSEIQREYFSLHPGGTNPVMLNDVIFSVHAFFVVAFTVYQCHIYESGSQRVSWTAKFILCLYAIILTISVILVYRNMIQWLDFLSCCSYIKLTVSVIKYIPQAIMNYSRKSTVGWNIDQVILRLIGGVFSTAQMVVNSYNYDDWYSIIGNPTKSGLGLLAIIFQALFMYQHYVLYAEIRISKYQKETPSTSTDINSIKLNQMTISKPESCEDGMIEEK